MQYFLSIDYGGTNTKAIIFDESGQQIAVSSFETLKIEDKPGFREVDLNETWQSISQSIKEVLAKSGLNPEAIKAVACIGHGKGLYVLDKEGQIFRRGILSTDNRALELAQELENKVSELWPLTKQHIVAVQNPVLLRWLRDYQPEDYQRIGSILSAKDFVRYQLTGKLNQEYGDASGNHWIDFSKGQYNPDILSFFGISEMASCLPPLVDCTEIVGGVSDLAAQQTGLLAGTPVVGGLFDIDACAIGSGVLTDDSFSVISGTWNINTYPSRTAAEQDSGQMNSYFPDRQYLVEASSPTSAGNLNTMLKMLMSEEIMTIKQNEQGSIYDTLEEFLGSTDAAYHGLIFFPFLYGSNANPQAKSCFFGLTTRSSKSQMLRAVYEGIAFAHKQHIDQLISSRGSRPQVIRLSGGAANSKACMQLFADVLNLPVETVQGTELGGLGGAISCLQAVQGLSLAEAVAKMVRVKERFEPNFSEHEVYQVKYGVYQGLLSAMDSTWDSLKVLEEMISEKEQA